MKPKSGVQCMCRGACTCKLRKAQANSKSAAEAISNFKSVSSDPEIITLMKSNPRRCRGSANITYCIYF